MDIQLQELIDKIKKDGVANAENQAASIIAEAEKKAAAIINDAQAKADSLVKSGKVETERLEKASIDAIRQASRNILISFRDGINAQLSAIITNETKKAFDANMLKTIIPETIKAWATKEDVNSLSVLLSNSDLKELESGLNAALKAEIAKGLEIKADKSLNKGFRIASKDGSAYYDFSAESVAELFASYLNPKNTQIMKDAIKEGSI